MERRAYRIAARVLREWLQQVQDAVSGGEGGPASAENRITREAVYRLIEEIYNAVGPAAAEREFHLVRERVRFAMKRESVLFSAGFFSRKWQELMRTLMADKDTASRVQQITVTTRRLIRDALTRAATDRLDIRATARLIREVLGGRAMRNRALLIARTETTRAANLGAQMGAESTGLVLEKVWIATGDSRTRPAHRAMLGKPPIPKDALFVVGGRKMKYPGDPAGGAANVVSCRCAVSYVPKMRNGLPVLAPKPDIPQRLAAGELMQELSEETV
ncbi:phage minor head protein [Larkinella soli]|uniref:phage minor head protein n=1 Tax=Larkinella soli TaxID=1770527 RepID=UPI0013E2E909|nr:phage minor head protein [Larkinella soli]